jgi:anthranilate phosphoribosyltransferase
MVGELKNGEITEYDIHPEDFGLPMASNRSLKVETPEQSKAMVQAILDNEKGAARDIVIFNAGVGLYAANVCDSIPAGIAKAREALESGAAKKKLQQLVDLSKKLSA